MRWTAALRHIWKQSHLARSFDSDRDLSLVPAAGAAHPTRPDPPSVGRIPPQLLDVLVVDLTHLVLTEQTRLPPKDLRLAAARTSRTRSRLGVLPSFRLRGHASNLQQRHRRCRPGAAHDNRPLPLFDFGHRAEGKDTPPPGEETATADDDLVGVVGVTLVADVIEPAEVCAVAREHSIARGGCEESAEFRLCPVAPLAPAILLHESEE